MKRLLLIAFFLAIGLPVFGQQWPPSAGGGGTGTVTVCGTLPVTNKIIYWSGPTEGCGINSPTIDPATGDVTFVRNVSITSTLSVGTGSAVAGALDLAQGTLPALGTTAVTFMAPTSVTSYGLLYPGAAPAAGQFLLWGAPSSSISTGAFTTYGTFAANGAASTPPVKVTGSWFSGGSSTTTKPQVLIEAPGASSTTWSTAGTGLGINSDSSFSGHFLKIQKDGADRFTIDSTGAVAGVAAFTTTRFISSATAAVGISLNSTGANFGYIGNVTSTSWALGYGGSTSTLGASALAWTDAGKILINDLKTTGAASGKVAVCVDTSTGQLYASSASGSCAN